MWWFNLCLTLMLWIFALLSLWRRDIQDIYYKVCFKIDIQHPEYFIHTSSKDLDNCNDLRFWWSWRELCQRWITNDSRFTVNRFFVKIDTFQVLAGFALIWENTIVMRNFINTSETREYSFLVHLLEFNLSQNIF